MKKLYKSKDDRILSGVCGGIAKYINVDSTLVRIAFVAITLSNFIFGSILYLICSIIIPYEDE